MTTRRFAAAAVVAAAITVALAPSAVWCYFVPDPYEAIANMMLSVMADDGNWESVLQQQIRPDEEALKGNAGAQALLKRLGLDNQPLVDALPVIRYLAVYGPGASGTELGFGLTVLGDALSCHMAGTVLLHTHLAAAYARRADVDAPTVRSCMSKIQAAVVGYVDKLSGLDRPVDYLLDYSNAVNAVFGEHDRDSAAVGVQTFAAALDNLVNATRKHLESQCGESNERTIAAARHATGYSDHMFDDLGSVDEHHLLTVIEELEDYEFAEFSGSGHAFWKDSMHVVEYRVQGNSSVQHEKDDDDEDDGDGAGEQ